VTEEINNCEPGGASGRRSPPELHRQGATAGCRWALRQKRLGYRRFALLELDHCSRTNQRRVPGRRGSVPKSYRRGFFEAANVVLTEGQDGGPQPPAPDEKAGSATPSQVSLGRAKQAWFDLQWEDWASGFEAGRRWAADAINRPALANLQAVLPKPGLAWDDFFAPKEDVASGVCERLHGDLYPEAKGDEAQSRQFWQAVARDPYPSPYFVMGLAEGAMMGWDESRENGKQEGASHGR
jgi:hypothetical protein